MSRIYLIFIYLLLVASADLHSQQYAPAKYYLVDSLDLQSISSRDKLLVDSVLSLYRECLNDTCKVNAVSIVVEESWDEGVWPLYNQWIHDFVLEKLTHNPDSIVLLHLRKSYAGALNNKGYLENSRGEIDLALEYYEKSLEIQREVDDKSSMAGTFINVGYIYLNIGFIEKALEYYYSSLKMYEETHDQLGVSTALNAIGYIHYKQGENEKALERYSESLKIREILKNQYGIATCLNNIGLIYRDRGQWEEALEYYERCLKLEEALGDKGGMAISLGNIGLVYKGLGQLEKALEFYFQSLEISKALNNKNGISDILNDIASIVLLKGNISKARKYAEESLRLAKELNYPVNIREAAQTLAEIEKRGQNWSKAFTYLELYHKMRDSIFNKETITTSINQQYKYKYEKNALADSLRNAEQLRISKVEKEQLQLKNQQKQRESYFLILGLLMTLVFSALIYNRLKLINRQKAVIEKQKEKVEKQKRQNEVYIESIQEQKKDLENLNQDLGQFAQIISHDLKAPLRGITGLVGMIEEDYPDMETELKHRINLIRERSVKTNQLIKGILTYSKAGRESVTKEQVDINALLEDIIVQLDNPKKVQIQVTSNCPKFYGNKYQLEQILTNLIENAVKYNHRGENEGKVKIRCNSTSQFHEFIISDNGPGISQKMQLLVFELFKKGHNIQKDDSTGIGLSIVKKLVTQNGGQVELFSREGEGATFKFTWRVESLHL